MYLSGYLGAYYLKNGQPTSSYQVGDVMGFNVPGYSQVWLDQTQSGNPQYSGPFNVPMPSYVLQARDVGTFRASVYELLPNGQKGKLIGTDSVVVQGAPAAQTTTVQQTIYAPPTVQAQQAPGYSNPGVTSSGAAVLSSGVATPTAPAPQSFVVTSPGGPIDLGPAPTPEAAQTYGDGGVLGGLGFLWPAVAVGLGLYLLGGRKR